MQRNARLHSKFDKHPQVSSEVRSHATRHISLLSDMRVKLLHIYNLELDQIRQGTLISLCILWHQRSTILLVFHSTPTLVRDRILAAHAVL